MKILLIAVGGALGAVFRYLITYIIGRQWGNYFPYGTLAVNLLGCLLIGIIMGLITEKAWIQPIWRFFLTIGFLGALTTFSSFSYEAYRLLEQGNIIYALTSILSNVIIGILAVWGGIGITRLL